MGKISPVVAKYIIHALIKIEGSVEKPDVIGAVFGQTEGLLGEGLELRELQRSGKIGRIDVIIEPKEGKTSGEIIIPSSLDKAETAIIAAALETIQKIGPCDSKVEIKNIEDVRVSKRDFVLSRAKDLLKDFTSAGPDSAELTGEVSKSVKMMDLVEYGTDRLPAGPMVEESEEIIIVEGRADILTLLKYGFKNTIALNGTSIPKTIIELCKKKTVIVFVDGDRGGDLIIKELKAVAEIDFIIKAPSGIEVEELTGKEIHKALRGRTPVDQFKFDNGENKIEEKKLIKSSEKKSFVKTSNKKPEERRERKDSYREREPRKIYLPKKDKEMFKEMITDLIGTRGAYILDKELNILGKVPSSELVETIQGLRDVRVIIFDGSITKEIVDVAERARIQYLIATNSKVKESRRVRLLTDKDLQ